MSIQAIVVFDAVARPSTDEPHPLAWLTVVTADEEYLSREPGLPQVVSRSVSRDIAEALAENLRTS